MSRPLPLLKNPFTSSFQTPPYEELLKKRRLQRFEPSPLSASNSSRSKIYESFDHACLAVPLPKCDFLPDLPQAMKGSDRYFLLRRCNDGYVSATYMFHATFPWANLEEQLREWEYIMKRKEISDIKHANCIWISPRSALELAEEYQIYPWVRALIDPSSIAVSFSAKDIIMPPPIFDFSVFEKHRRDGKGSSQEFKDGFKKEETTTEPKPSPTSISSIPGTRDDDKSKSTQQAGNIPQPTAKLDDMARVFLDRLDKQNAENRHLEEQLKIERKQHQEEVEQLQQRIAELTTTLACSNSGIRNDDKRSLSLPSGFQFQFGAGVPQMQLNVLKGPGSEELPAFSDISKLGAEVGSI